MLKQLLLTNCRSFAQWFGLVSQRFLCQGTEPCHMQGPPIQNAVHVQRLFFRPPTGGFLSSLTAICVSSASCYYDTCTITGTTTFAYTFALIRYVFNTLIVVHAHYTYTSTSLYTSTFTCTSTCEFTYG